MFDVRALENPGKSRRKSVSEWATQVQRQTEYYVRCRGSKVAMSWGQKKVLNKTSTKGKVILKTQYNLRFF